MTYPDLFQHYQPLKGSAWLRTIQPEDLKAFVMIGFQESDYGRKGGKGERLLFRREVEPICQKLAGVAHW